MTMLAETKDSRVTSLAEYEARIHLYKEQIGTGYIGIGRTLNEAKEAKVVPHGEWEAWVERTTGLTIRQAQRCMQAATEIRDGSAMARLEMSKALLLLGSGLDEERREEMAEKAAEEGTTVKELREQLRQAKLQLMRETGDAVTMKEEMKKALERAESERDQLRGQMKATLDATQERLIQQRDILKKQFEEDTAEIERRRLKAEEEAARLRRDLREKKNYAEDLEAKLEDAQNMTRVVTKETAPADYEQLKRDRADLLAAAEDAEKRAAEAEAELEALRAGGGQAKENAWKILKGAVDRFMGDCELLPCYPGEWKTDYPEEQKIEQYLDWLESWCRAMRDAMAGVVVAEGAVR